MSRPNHRQRLLLGAMALAVGAYAFGVNAAAAGDTVLYDFCSFANCTDGEYPTGDLIRNVNTLYGTTLLGGNANTACSGVGCGTVFSITTSGTHTVLHSFGSVANDGVEPYAGVLRVGNRLYGTTGGGGQFAGGTVYRLRPNGTAYQILHSFCSLTNCADGNIPLGGLIDIGGTLYGTTEDGGAGSCGSSNGCGTVFEIQPNGTGFQVLYSFCSLANCADGAGPTARLLDVGGTLYGTTAGGGALGDGTVFSVTPCGIPPCAESVVYSFGTNTPDGQYPESGLIYKVVGSTGYLFGTTSTGGASLYGTVFAVLPCATPPCTEPWQYSFLGGPGDGGTSYSDLLDMGPYLYGTTSYGGASGIDGTAFKIKANGLAPESLINSFANNPDGADPNSGLTHIGAVLYGTTADGGTHSVGTVFSIP